MRSHQTSIGLELLQVEPCRIWHGRTGLDHAEPEWGQAWWNGCCRSQPCTGRARLPRSDGLTQGWSELSRSEAGLSRCWIEGVELRVEPEKTEPDSTQVEAS